MRSASNRDVFQSRLQVLHVHVLLVAPLGAGYMSQSGTDQHQSGATVQEASDLILPKNLMTISIGTTANASSCP